MDQRRPDFRQASKLVLDLAGALDYAPQRGVVHRDFKPANIMLDVQGDPLVMDFGLARLDAAESRLTHDGTVLGTPAYRSPEQAGGQLDRVGPASDQYSLGVVLYELLCGSTPFSGPPSLVISLVLNHEPDSPCKSNPAVPKDLETICQKAMAKQPEHRYASCREMAEDLRRWLAGEPITARRVSPVERFGRCCYRNPVVAGLAGAAAMLLLMVAVVATTAWVHTSRALGRADAEWERVERALEQQFSAERGKLTPGTVDPQSAKAGMCLVGSIRASAWPSVRWNSPAVPALVFARPRFARPQPNRGKRLSGYVRWGTRPCCVLAFPLELGRGCDSCEWSAFSRRRRGKTGVARVISADPSSPVLPEPDVFLVARTPPLASEPSLHSVPPKQD